MYFTEMMTTAAFFICFTVCFSVAVGGTLVVIHRSVQAYLKYLERDLELRRYVADTHVEQARLNAGIPVWVDREDPSELAAWNRAVAETWRISAAQALELNRS